MDHEFRALIAGYVATRSYGLTLSFEGLSYAVRSSLADCPLASPWDDMLCALSHYWSSLLPSR